MSTSSCDVSSRLSRDQLEARCNLLESQLRSMDRRVRELWRENCDLRALACFLDDERIAARDLAREMGENTRGEWMAMRSKLQQLEERQFELVRDNFELKQLCLILDAERESEIDYLPVNNTAGTQGNNQIYNQQVLSYIRDLESRLLASEPEPELMTRRPQVLNDALRVLHIHDNEDNSSTTREERAILNNLCRTAWKKLEETETL